MKIRLNNKYSLSLLTEVRKDYFQHLISVDPGCYISEIPNKDWLNFNKIESNRNFSVNKKMKFFRIMKNKNSFCISPSSVSFRKKTQKLILNNIIHINGFKINTRLNQIYAMINIIRIVFKKRRQIDFLFYYNFDFYSFVTAYFFKYILNKKIYVDFEDDYLTIDQNFMKKFIKKNILYKLPDKVICINHNMTKYFNSNKTYVFNGFIELEYLKNINYEFKNPNLFFGSTLDEIRGADLIEDLIIALRKKFKLFKLTVTGTGPLHDSLKNLNFKELDFRGFVEEKTYENLINDSDICLVLQKPDHPFSRSSFPSKIEYYSRHKKPILKLVLN